MAGKAVKAVRSIYAITGVLALVAGIALLFAPAKSLVFLTTVLGFYFVITAAIRLFTAVFEPLLPTGWRVTSIISNLLIILGGVIILRNQAFFDRDAHDDGGYRGRLWLDRRRVMSILESSFLVQPRPRHPERLRPPSSPACSCSSTRCGRPRCSLSLAAPRCWCLALR